MRSLYICFISIALSGCSWLFHDHATDYLDAKAHPPIKVPSEYGPTPKPMLVIPDAEQPFVASEEIVVPRPEPLVVEEEQQVASLSQVQNTTIDPQLLKDGNGTPILRLGVAFPRAWSALGEALKAADIKVTDLNRSIGTYYIEVPGVASQEEPGFWSWLFGESEVEPISREVKLNRARSGVYVAIHNDSETLAEEAEANALLEKISKNIK